MMPIIGDLKSILVALGALLIALLIGLRKREHDRKAIEIRTIAENAIKKLEEAKQREAKQIAQQKAQDIAAVDQQAEVAKTQEPSIATARATRMRAEAFIAFLKARRERK